MLRGSTFVREIVRATERSPRVESAEEGPEEAVPLGKKQVRNPSDPRQTQPRDRPGRQADQ
jgi:hypothetical protein